MPLPHPQGRRLTATPSLRAQRIATTALFALDGLVFGSWAVLPLMVNPFGFVAALAAGVAVAAALVIVLKSRFPRAGAAGSRLGEPDEAESR